MEVQFMAKLEKLVITESTKEALKQKREPKKQKIQDVVKEELKITNEGVQRCPVCDGEGFTKKGKGQKSLCSHCEGAGFTYHKPERPVPGRSTAEEQKKTEPKKSAKEVKQEQKKELLETQEYKILS